MAATFRHAADGRSLPRVRRAADIAALADRATRPRYHRNVALLRALQHLRRGEHRDAHDLAIRTLAETTRWGTAGLRAVQREAAHQLGVPCDVDLRDLCDRLRNSGQAAWASRLEALSATGA